MESPLEAVITGRFQRVTLTLLAVVATLILFEACSSPPGPPRTAATPSTAETQAGKPVFEADPSFRQAAGKLLPGVPEFPSYPGASLLGSAERNSPNAAKQGHRIEWTTTDSVPSVMAWYQKTLQERGWTYTPPTDGVIHSQLAGISRGDLDGTLEAEWENGVTRITVVLGPKQD